MVVLLWLKPCAETVRGQIMGPTHPCFKACLPLCSGVAGMGGPTGMTDSLENQSESPGVSSSGYRTAPLAMTGMPPGISYIIGNEAAERFSFYGMKAILVVFMTKYLADSSGNLAVLGAAGGRAFK